MVALVVLNYNDYAMTEAFVNSIKEYSAIDKIIIVDNCSIDSSYEKLLPLQSDIIDIIQTSENRGYASGNNFGARYALEMYSPQYLVIANPDIRIDKNLVRDLLHVFESRPDAGAVACKMVSRASFHTQIAWKLPQYRDCLLENLFILKRILRTRTEYTKDDLSKDIVCVDVLPGSFFILSAEAFRAVNGFDEHTFLYYEENILAFKLKANGYKEYLITTREYIHQHGVTINRNIRSVRKRFETAQKSRYWYCVHYLKIKRLQRILLKVSFKIGLLNYLIFKRIVGYINEMLQNDNGRIRILSGRVL